MRWTVETADPKTGKEQILQIEADSKEQAEQIVRSQGLLVSEMHLALVQEPKQDGQKFKAAISPQRNKLRIPSEPLKSAGSNTLNSAADFVLSWTFGFAKWISVIVVVACFVTILICCILLAIVHERKIPPPSSTPVAPSVSDYQAIINLKSNSTDVSNDPEASSQIVKDPLMIRLQAIVSQIGVDSSSWEEILDAFHSDSVDASVYVAAMESFVNDLKQHHIQPTGYSLAWFSRQYHQNADVIHQLHERYQNDILLAEQEARRDRTELAALIGSALAALLSFLFLPLLIQIERNTRNILKTS